MHPAYNQSMIYFLRHGQSQANVDKIFAGPHYPAPLTTTGRDQATEAGEWIKASGIVIDSIVTSPIERAKITAAIVASVIGFEQSDIIYDSRLVEYDMGALSGTPMGVTPQQLISAKGAEDPYKFKARIQECLEDIRKDPGSTLIVSHAGVGRMIEAIRLGFDPKDFYELEGYPNARVVDINSGQLI